MTRFSSFVLLCCFVTTGCSTSVRTAEPVPAVVPAEPPPELVAASEVVSASPAPEAVRESSLSDDEVASTDAATYEVGLATWVPAKSDCARPPAAVCCRAMTRRCLDCRRRAQTERAAWDDACRRADGHQK